jgi:hypothetical protein
VCGNRPERTGDELNVNTAVNKLRNHLLHFAITHERVAANEGDVHGTVLLNNGQDAGDQGVSAVVGELAKGDGAAQMLRIVRIATRAAERAFSGDLDRQERSITCQNVAPRLKDFGRSHTDLLNLKSSATPSA